MFMKGEELLQEVEEQVSGDEDVEAHYGTLVWYGTPALRK